ncbi:hypothetical protein BOTCAL_0070g00280 [Botryotinia calthae]|uniref:Uncharacterized protein n=1 Tax=Botryotinia calthae TaxID=38488 RepID=A0A4Y8DBD7_9HELO|nr:hypothetical protein BOTCAL_0070g00280 [Botryotinia calthae]
MVRSTNIIAAILSPVSLAIGFTLFIYFNPPGHLWNSPSASFTKEESSSYQSRGQSWALLLFLFAFSMSFMPFALKIWDGRRNKTEHEVTLQAETKEDTKAETKTTKLTTSIKSTKLTEVESETSETKEARSTKIEPSNFSAIFKMNVELVKAKTALKIEQERVNRIELVMESLQSQIGVLQAKLTVKEGEAKNKRKRVQAIEEDRQRQADILTRRIMIQEAKMEEVLERLEKNDRSHDAIDVCIENFTNEGVKTKEELKRFDCLDNKINEVEDLLVDEISNLEETAKDNLEELRADILGLENYLTEVFQNLEDKRHSRELEIKKEIKNEVKEELRREQEKKELDELREERLKMWEVAANEEIKDEMKAVVTNTVPTVESSSQTEAETTETGMNQEAVETKDDDKKQETDPLTEIETMIREREYYRNRSVNLAIHYPLIRQRDTILKDLENGGNGVMEDLEQGKDNVMEDTTDMLMDTVEGEGKGSGSDEDWDKL